MLHNAAVEICQRRDCPDLREIQPDSRVNHGRINLVEFFDGDEGVNRLDRRQINVFKKTMGDLTAILCQFFG